MKIVFNSSPLLFLSRLGFLEKFLDSKDSVFYVRCTNRYRDTDIHILSVLFPFFLLAILFALFLIGSISPLQ
ncbi:hypothetical protein [Microcystis aeruginosa]|uniref:hypothetical protein n=1 Tax=Microcystis aeruginosa TaxID=1126 RepID=UPI00125AAC80|nr:hypothetical protein [Microcystis aeruginosa]GCA89766.1 hypothetical protein MiTa_03119 [Microcystis aeruginosa NIES-4264]